MAIQIVINPSEEFPHLSKAPVVEAILDFRARATVQLDVPSLVGRLAKMLPDYSEPKTIRDFSQEITMTPADDAPKSVTRELGWRLSCTSSNDAQVATFSPDGFSISRLHPYSNWVDLGNEAARLRKVFLDIAKPLEIQRIGVRYINKIDLPKDQAFEMEDYIQPAPQPPRHLSLPYTGFFHQDVFCVLGYPYAIRLSKTIQLPAALIIDIDVFKSEATEIRDDIIQTALSELRWLKNKMFFGTVTEKVLETHR